VTGDTPGTTLEIARQIGLISEDSGDGKDVLVLYIEKSDYLDEYSEYYKIVKLHSIHTMNIVRP